MLHDLLERKFVDVVETDEWEVESEEGWVPVRSINKTIPYAIWNITLEDGRVLQCADTHIFIDSNDNEVFAKDSLNVSLKTKEGVQKVVSVVETDQEDYMYDLTVDSEKHTFFGDGVLSHNTTTNAASVLHYVLFNERKTVGILANKAATAREILGRIQLMYEHLPFWMQVGVTTWNKGTMELGNGSKVLAAATSSSAIRGCLSAETEIVVLDTKDNSVSRLTLGSLFMQMESHELSPNIRSNANRFRLKTPSGFGNFESIVRYEYDSFISLRLEEGRKLGLSPDHAVYTTKGWISAENLKEGDEVFTEEGTVRILEKRFVEEKCFLYDPTWVVSGETENVPDDIKDHCFYANGIISKNSSLNWVLLDEFAFVPQNQADEFFESVYPTISSGKSTKISIFSTPKGMNRFYKMWIEATEGRSEFTPLSIAWNEVPGRDEAWKEKTISNIGQESWDQEFECQFLGSSNSLISMATLKRLVHATPIAETESLKVYEEPIPGHVYFLSVDCSRGAKIDYSVIQVTDISEYPFKQVAVFRDNAVNHYMLPKVIVNLAKKYNNGYVLVEINDIGEAVADSIYHDEEYENLLTTGEVKNRIYLGAWKNSKNGLRTTKSSKRTGCSTLKTLVESGKYLINDWDTIQELSTFVSKANTYMAEEGTHDDTVMALVVFAWAADQEYFKDLTNRDIQKTFIEENYESTMEEISPIGFFDGLEEIDSEWQLVE